MDVSDSGKPDVWAVVQGTRTASVKEKASVLREAKRLHLALGLKGYHGITPDEVEDYRSLQRYIENCHREAYEEQRLRFMESTAVSRSHLAAIQDAVIRRRTV